ncbi:hypothetical protein RR46_07332 [Papilio xuthus]|uniref:Uncharacterized protein n=1 Tax=Papilio xuthus TaxID=66420 RepID=A0A194Q2F5_PAPXU|nr:hypothetical protein RR46_07332 [Papilio xuthus]
MSTSHNSLYSETRIGQVLRRSALQNVPHQAHRRALSRGHEHGNAPGHMAGPVHHGQVAVMRARTHCAYPAPRYPRPRPATPAVRRATIP